MSADRHNVTDFLEATRAGESDAVRQLLDEAAPLPLRPSSAARGARYRAAAADLRK